MELCKSKIIIEIYDFNNFIKTIENFVFDASLMQSMLDVFNETERLTGLRISLEKLVSAESFIADYYKNKFKYEIIRLEALKRHADTVAVDFLSKNTNKDELYWTEQLTLSGVPDFFCYKSKEDFFFLEIKSENDTLGLKQLDWVFRNKDYSKIKLVHTSYVEE